MIFKLRQRIEDLTEYLCVSAQIVTVPLYCLADLIPSLRLPVLKLHIRMMDQETRKQFDRWLKAKFGEDAS